MKKFLIATALGIAISGSFYASEALARPTCEQAERICINKGFNPATEAFIQCVTNYGGNSCQFPLH